MHFTSRNLLSKEMLDPLAVKRLTIDGKRDSRPPSSTLMLRRKKLPVITTDLESKYQELLETYEQEKEKNQTLYSTSLSNQEKFIKREQS